MSRKRRDQISNKEDTSDVLAETLDEPEFVKFRGTILVDYKKSNIQWVRIGLEAINLRVAKQDAGVADSMKQTQRGCKALRFMKIATWMKAEIGHHARTQAAVPFSADLVQGLQENSTVLAVHFSILHVQYDLVMSHLFLLLRQPYLASASIRWSSLAVYARSTLWSFAGVGGHWLSRQSRVLICETAQCKYRWLLHLNHVARRKREKKQLKKKNYLCVPSARFAWNSPCTTDVEYRIHSPICKYSCYAS